MQRLDVGREPVRGSEQLSPRPVMREDYRPEPGTELGPVVQKHVAQ